MIWDSPIIFPLRRGLLLTTGTLLVASGGTFVDDDAGANGPLGYIPAPSQTSAPVQAFQADDDWVPAPVPASANGLTRVILPAPDARVVLRFSDDDWVTTPPLRPDDDAWLPPVPRADARLVRAVEEDTAFVAASVTVALDDDGQWTVYAVRPAVQRAVVAITADDELPVVAAPAVPASANGLTRVLLPPPDARVVLRFSDDEFVPSAAPSVVDDDAGWTPPRGASPFRVAAFTADDDAPLTTPTLADDDAGWAPPVPRAVRAPLPSLEADDFTPTAQPALADDDAGWVPLALAVPRAVAPFLETDDFVPPVVLAAVDDDAGWAPRVGAVPRMVAPFTDDDGFVASVVDDDAGWWVPVPRAIASLVQAVQEDGSWVPPSLAYADDESSAWTASLAWLARRGLVGAVPVGGRAAIGFDPELYARGHIAALRGALAARPRLTGALASHPRLTGALGVRARLTETDAAQPRLTGQLATRPRLTGQLAVRPSDTLT